MLPPISLDARTPLGGTSTRLARPSLTVALLLATGCAVTHGVPPCDLSVGYGHACVTGRERAYCWGRSELGQLGVRLPDWSTAIETPVEIDW